MFFTYWDDLGSTPARVNRYTGEIQINNRYFDSMPELRGKFIIEHEKGHFLNDTRSEFEADKYAFKKIAGSAPRSLKETVFAISRVLTFKNPQHMQRLAEVVRMALEYDVKHNNNPKAIQALQELKSLKTQSFNPYKMETSNSSYFEPKYGQDNYDGMYDNAGGKARRQAKKADRDTRKSAKQDSKQENRDLKNQRKSAKNEVTLAKADSKRTRAEAKKINADKGDGSSWWDRTLTGVKGLFSKDGGGSTEVSTAEDFAVVDPNASPKLLGMPKGVAIVVIVVLVIGIIVGIFFAVRKKA